MKSCNIYKCEPGYLLVLTENGVTKPWKNYTEEQLFHMMADVRDFFGPVPPGNPDIADEQKQP